MPETAKNIAKALVEYVRKFGPIYESNPNLAKELGCVASMAGHAKRRLFKLGILVHAGSGFQVVDKYFNDDSYQQLLKRRLPNKKSAKKSELLLDLDAIKKQAQTNAELSAKIVEVCKTIEQKQQAINTLEADKLRAITALEYKTKERVDDLKCDIADLKVSLARLQSGNLDGDKPEYLAALYDFKKQKPLPVEKSILIVDDKAGGAVLTPEETQAQRVGRHPNQPLSYSGR